jgi:hypothetical protein
MTSTAAAPVDRSELEGKVKAMYRAVAEDPGASYHFELGRALAERLGYPAPILDRIPAGAVESFAGVGYVFDLADLKEGEHVLDLGSGSGMDVFFAALQVGGEGRVDGVDMTREQLEKAERLRTQGAFDQVTFTAGHIEELPFPDGSFDVVVSNGSSTSSPTSVGCSARRPGCCDRVAGSSSSRRSSPNRSSPTPACGPPASVAPPSRTPISRPSKRAGCGRSS